MTSDDLKKQADDAADVAEANGLSATAQQLRRWADQPTAGEWRALYRKADEVLARVEILFPDLEAVCSECEHPESRHDELDACSECEEGAYGPC